MRRQIAVPVTAVCAALGVACGGAEAPSLPSAALVYSPPPVYAVWWGIVQQCAGTTGSLQDITWFRVPAVSLISFDVDGVTRQATGYWSSSGNRIVMAGDRVYDGQAVRHEMLHALIRMAGHPRDAFLRRCAGVVSCGTDCLADAGPPRAPDPASPRVASSALEVDFMLLPAQPSASVNDGAFMLLVQARNPATRAVVVELSPSNHQLPGRTFWWEMRRGDDSRASDGMPTFDGEALMFEAGEVKRQVFDFRFGERMGDIFLAPGDYLMRGGYDLTFTELRPVTLGN
jgi:hypothetical protein